MRAIAAALALACAGAAGAQATGSAMDDLFAQGKKCTGKYGFDPAKAEGLGEYQLGPGERRWRDCMYQWIRDVVIPSTSIPSTYRELIAYDRMMTDRIEAKKMTRGQRAERIDRLLIDALEREEAVVAQGSVSQSEQEVQQLEADRKRLVKMREDAVKMRRIESMMAR